MERFGVDEVRAFGMLRELSQESNVKLVEVAQRSSDPRPGLTRPPSYELEKSPTRTAQSEPRMSRFQAATVAVIAALAVFPSVLSPNAAANGCADVELVFARGTGEPPELGRVGDALADALRPQLGARSLGTYAVDYPANRNFLSTRNGANDAAAHIADVAARCPGTRVVLGGFSQGAAVVSMLAGVAPIGDRIGDIGSAPPLSPDSAGTVGAVAVFGNPGNRLARPCRPTVSSPVGRSTCAATATRSAFRAGAIGLRTATTTDRPTSAQAAGFVAGLVTVPGLGLTPAAQSSHS